MIRSLVATCCHLRYNTLTHLYASNLQQFWLAFLKIVRRRVVQSEALIEALHKPTWVNMMNRSVLNLHQSRKTIWKRITTVGIVNSWKDARRLEKEWQVIGKKGHDFHLLFYTELVRIWLMVCGETPYFNLDKENKLYHKWVKELTRPTLQELFLPGSCWWFPFPPKRPLPPFPVS